jgi:hypothetical protein
VGYCGFEGHSGAAARMIRPAARPEPSARERQITEVFVMYNVTRRNAVRFVLLAAAAPFVGSVASFAAEPAPLAIKGYDPVAYFTMGRPVRGLPEIEYKWDEERYRFSSVKHRELFKANPARYAPQFASFCAMALAQGELLEANPKYWLISDGKLYIFGKPIGPALFQRDLAGNIAKANQNRAMVQKN